MAETAKVLAGCGIVFLLPVAAGGLGMIVLAVSRVPTREWETVAVGGVMGLVFTTTAIVGMVLVVRASKHVASAVGRLSAMRDAPWRLRADWAAGRVKQEAHFRSAGSWAFTVLWNLLCIPGAFLILREALPQGQHAAWFVLLFPLVGVGLLAAAIRDTIRHRRYGDSVAVLDAVPAAVGQDLTGRVECRLDPRLAPSVRLTLSCVRRVITGHGKNRSTREDIQWQDTRDVRPEIVGGGTRIPFRFAVPSHLPPADVTPSQDRIAWYLEAEADVPGVDYRVRFELPVFATAVSECP